MHFKKDGLGFSMENRLKGNEKVRPGEGQLTQRTRDGSWPPGPRRPGEGAMFPMCFKLELTRLAGLDEDTTETGVEDTSKHFDLRK